MNVTVQTEPPDVAAILIESTYIDLVCDVDSGNSSGVSVSFTWSGPNGNIVSVGTDYSITDQVNSSTLRIEELSLDRDNNAEYTCSVMAVVGSDTVESSNSLTLIVRGMIKQCLNIYRHNCVRITV